MAKFVSENMKQEIKECVQAHFKVVTESFGKLFDRVEKLEENEVQKALSEEGYNLSFSLEHPLEKKLEYQHCPHCGKKLRDC